MSNKSLLTNSIAIFMMLLSLFVNDTYTSNLLLYMGLFAFSGAITNTLAIHMLFEKVPFLYGSGVIVNRFEAFKASIRSMIMQEFFSQKQIDDFFTKEEQKIELAPLIETTDFTPAYDALKETVMESPFGNMLGMFGGEQALEGLKEPFSEKLRKSVVTITQSETFNLQLQNMLADSSLSSDVQERLEQLIDQRLDELTPIMVKDLMQELIREHLGWLVVWGGVFGGLIGLISSFL
ncbi:MAG: DUF445 domain-containing protein [Campylobacterota bacterium]|nr:DUF445 domain-containing protein [Campylobacterota bacterium]